MKRILSFFLALASCGILIVNAQTSSPSQSDIESFVAHEWIHTPVSASLDQFASGKCEGGKSFIFTPEGTVEVKECIQSRMRSVHHDWTLSQSEYGDWQITIGEILYQLETHSSPGKDKLILSAIEAQTDALTSISLYRLTPVAEEEGIEEE